MGLHPVSIRYERVLELTYFMHTDLPHHIHRGLIQDTGESIYLILSQLIKSKIQTSSRSLLSKALSPMSPRQSPSDLHAGSKKLSKRGLDKPVKPINSPVSFLSMAKNP